MAAPSPPRRRHTANLASVTKNPILGRLAIVNHFSRKVKQLAPTTKRPMLSAFLPGNLWPWVKDYLRFALTPKFPFPTYTEASKNGVYSISPSAGADEVTIAIAGDWATGTNESAKIADLMAAKKPTLTIHLGDVYHVGDEDEVQENCFGATRHGFEGVVWPHGEQGSFALNGNHEMYANGKAYFTTFLQSLGLRTNPGQEASFFCLEVGGWRIIAIDTGYNSVGVPLLSQIPWIKRIPFIGGDAHLDRKIIEWLRTNVKPAADKKPTLLLSHHQYFTAFKNQSNHPKPAKQLEEFLKDREVVWLWGHEHRLAIYDVFVKDSVLQAYGRCVGHGGMPLDTDDLDPKSAPLRFYDKGKPALDAGKAPTMAKNGYVVLTVKNDTLALDYRNIDDELVFTEVFRPAPDGKLTRTFENKQLQAVSE